MLIRVMATVFLLAGITPAQAQQDPWPSYTLSGSAARALDAAFQSQYGSSPQSIEPDTKVHIVQSAGGVLVRFEHAGGRSVSLTVARNGTVSTPSNLTSSDAEVVIPALDASAITTTYEAWKSGSVIIPQSRADFDGDRFTVGERALLDSALSRSLPGYYVTYSPPPEQPAPSGMYCGNFMNYRVDPSTWKVSPQPRIC
jgi:hypothetical protein